MTVRNRFGSIFGGAVGFDDLQINVHPNNR